MAELRQYQKKALDKIRDEFRHGKKRVILAQPTGSGKSVIALEIIKSALKKGKRIAFCVDRLVLLDQFCEMVYDAGIEEFGIMQADNPLYMPYLPLQIITAQTLGRRSVQPFDLVCWDESHVLYSSLLKKMQEWDTTYWVGLTASPFTRGLGRHWQSIVNGTTTAQLIREGYLCQYKAYGPSKPDLKGVRTSAGDYNKKDLSQRVQKKKLYGDIINHWTKLASDRKTVAMCVDVAHAESLAEEFSRQSIKAETVHCYQSRGDIQRKLKQFKNGDIQVLTSVDQISRGFNQPDAACLIIARPTKSLNYHIQSIGRILRACPGKENAIILDHAGNIERLGFPDDEFEMYLDMGTGDKKERRKKKKESLPKTCPSCKELIAVGRKCEACGFELKRKPKIKTQEAQLAEIQKRRNKKASSENKQKKYAKLLAGAEAAGFKPGWAAVKYKEYYGVWPNKYKDTVLDIDLLSWLNSLPKYERLRAVFSMVPSQNGRAK